MLSLLRYLHTAAGEAWLRADVSVVRLVLCRSSLHINSELAAAAALAAWTAATCARLQLEPAPDTVRQTAADCQYLVRTMSQPRHRLEVIVLQRRLTFQFYSGGDS